MMIVETGFKPSQAVKCQELSRTIRLKEARMKDPPGEDSEEIKIC